MQKGLTINVILAVLTLLLAMSNLLCGSVEIPAEQVFRALSGGSVDKDSWRYIIMESRLPQTVTSLLCGASLSVSGLLLQTVFRNPLAGPSILGITNGASLGVALVLLLFGGVIDSELLFGGTSMPVSGFLAVIIGAFLGSAAVIAMLLLLSTVIHSTIMLLIVGIMISYITSSIVSLLNFFSNADSIQSYVMWGMGSFSDVSLSQLPYFSIVSILGLLISLLLIKPLNALLLGDNYAANLGVDTRLVRLFLLMTTGLLTAVCTAFCGPIAFIGLAVPHIARLLTGQSNHTILLPATILSGAVVALLCNLICILPGNMIIPINAVTPLFGAPVIIYILLAKK